MTAGIAAYPILMTDSSAWGFAGGAVAGSNEVINLRSCRATECLHLTLNNNREL